MFQQVECLETRGSSCANNPDEPGAKPAPAGSPRHSGSGRGFRVCDTSVTDWPACWPGGNPAWSSSVDASSSGNPGRKTCCNTGTYVASAWGSSRAESTITTRRIKTKPQGRRTAKAKKQEEISGEDLEEYPREENGRSDRRRYGLSSWR